MASRFQAAGLAASPSYPNAITWSDENLIAVACGHVVTILNPSSPVGPRGLITIPDSEPYPIGRVKRDDLLIGCLLPTALSRDRRPCVRSISWSPIGMAPNSGCLLAVCTVEGRVKLYSPPFCDFCAEWIEVIDISDRLYDYLSNSNFGELDIPSSEFAHERGTQQQWADELLESCANNLPNSVSRKEHKRKRVNVTIFINKESETLRDQSDPKNGKNGSVGSSPRAKMKGKRLTNVLERKSGKLKKNIPESCTLPLITADQYGFCSALLSSLVVAWSPMLSLSSKIFSVPQNNSSNRFSILAVGGKSGKISFWRIHGPKCYTIESSRIPPCVMLVGLLQAHSSWVTTISLALLGSNSNHKILLASGSSDGSVKIWLGNGEELSEANNAPFILLKEVISVNTVSVSVLSLQMPVQSLCKMLLAVGRGSGSFDIWTCDIPRWKFDKAGSYDSHDHVITGLTWAFDGCCLYSCSQDNYVRGWMLHGNSLCEVPIPSNTPGLRSSADVPEVFLSCLGVAVSPGNVVLAMVRNPDVHQLDPMYEARCLKTVVEFFWIGGQQLNMLSDTSPNFGSEHYLGFCANELVYWETNILCSLKKYENLDKPLVIWDIIAALLAFKQSIPEYVDHILVKWLSTTYLGSPMDLPIDEVLTLVSKSLSKVTSRQLHLLNIICRRIMQPEINADGINCKVNLGGPNGAEGEQSKLWMELLLGSERELRERLVGFGFSAFLGQMSHSAKTLSESGFCYPDGVAHMERWVALNHDSVRYQLKVLASDVGKHAKSLHSSEYEGEEQCSYCSASVPFESPDVAFCKGLKTIDGVVEKHKQARCAVSMQLCPTTHLWFCKCCNRWASKLAPKSLFTMTECPSDFKSLTESVVEELSKPFCPFCGILLQRLQPEFLLSASPV